MYGHEYVTLDQTVLRYVQMMQDTGLLFDRERNDETMDKIDDNLAAIRGLLDVYHIDPRRPASVVKALPKEVIRKLPKTSTGNPSTGKDALLASGDSIAKMIIKYRELDKLKSTYLGKIPQFVSADDGRIHARWQMGFVPSGRLSCRDPNLMAFPKRTAEGKLIRQAFVAPEGWLLGAWDLSQIELRVLAHESQDDKLLAVFRENRDLHQDTADGLGVSRAFAKSINFLMSYLGGPETLSAKLASQGVKKSSAECHEIIAAWYDRYSGVREYSAEYIRGCVRAGGVARSWTNRPRNVAGVLLTGYQYPSTAMRADAERKAVNHAIQAGAQDLIKMAMVSILNTVLPKYHGKAKPVLQIHDELAFEVHESVKHEFEHDVLDALTNTITLRVPVEADGGYGRCWSDI
jgi:DNA polymerase-1